MAAVVADRARTSAMSPIERASPADRAFLAMDSGRVPEQFGVLLLLDAGPGLDQDQVRELIGARIPAVPRLRQRLVGALFGCGGPVWIDDQGFDIRKHVRAVACPPPGDEQALLDEALAITMTRLPRSAPLWSATLITGLRDSRAALVIVLHHTLADGVGGLAVLAGLVDGGNVSAAAPAVSFPRPVPGAARLAADAWRTRLRGLGRIPRWWHLLRESFGAGGGFAPPPAERCSLNQRTGRRRAIAVVGADHAALRRSAHQHGATTNDAVLVAVATALGEVLRSRGETISTLAMAVPVSGRRAAGDPALGNMVSPMMVYVPVAGDLDSRLEAVAEQVRQHKESATGPAPIALLGGLFRPLAAMGGYRFYMGHQHRLHTLVSHVRGPSEPVSFGGVRITSAIPIVVGDGGNIPVFVEALSYAGTLAVTMISDPDVFPEAAALSTALRCALADIARPAAPPRPAGDRQPL